MHLGRKARSRPCHFLDSVETGDRPARDNHLIDPFPVSRPRRLEGQGVCLSDLLLRAFLLYLVCYDPFDVRNFKLHHRPLSPVSTARNTY